MIKGKLIAIDGADGVGKATQAKLLYDNITKKTPGKHLFVSFPRYTTPTGKIIADYLNGKITDITRYDVAKMYADDRLAAREAISKTLISGHHVVADRYVLSNMAYQSSFYLAHDDNAVNLANTMLRYIEKLEYEDNNMPAPDLQLVLSIPLEISSSMIENKQKRNYTDKTKDIYENNLKLQYYVNNFFKNIKPTSLDKPIITIDCYDADGVKSIEAISQIVLDNVRPIIF